MNFIRIEKKIVVLGVYFMLAQSSMTSRATADALLLKYFDESSIPLMVMAAAGDAALKQFEANQLKWKALAEADEPYRIDFRPPTREGGWTGERRPGE